MEYPRVGFFWGTGVQEEEKKMEGFEDGAEAPKKFEVPAELELDSSGDDGRYLIDAVIVDSDGRGVPGTIRMMVGDISQDFPTDYRGVPKDEIRVDFNTRQEVVRFRVLGTSINDELRLPGPRPTLSLWARLNNVLCFFGWLIAATFLVYAAVSTFCWIGWNLRHPATALTMNPWHDFGWRWLTFFVFFFGSVIFTPIALWDEVVYAYQAVDRRVTERRKVEAKVGETEHREVKKEKGPSSFSFGSLLKAEVAGEFLAELAKAIFANIFQRRL